jgi:hypothetical protein
MHGSSCHIRVYREDEATGMLEFRLFFCLIGCLEKLIGEKVSFTGGRSSLVVVRSSSQVKILLLPVETSLLSVNV